MTKFIIGDISTFPVTADPAEITGSLKISGSSANARIHVIGGTGGPAIRATGSVEIAGDLTVTGTTTTVTTDNTLVKDKLITLNDGGGASSGGGAGIEIEESSGITGYFKTSSDRAKWELKAPSTSNTLFIEPAVTNKTLSVHDDTALNQNLRTTDSPQFLAVNIVDEHPRLNITTNNDNGDGQVKFIANDSSVLANFRCDNTGNSLNHFSINSGTSEFDLVVHNSGKIGIGTATPDNQLEVLSSTAPQMRLTHTDATDYATFGVDGDGQLSITTDDGGGTGGHICLLPDGNVGIGTTSPETALHLQDGSAGTIATTSGALLTLESNEKPKIHFQSPGGYGGSIIFGSPTDNDEGQIDYDHGSDRFLFKTGGNTKMTILGDKVGVGITSPDTVLHVSSSSSTEAALTVDGGVVFNRTEKNTATGGASITYTILESDYLIGCKTESSRTIALTLPKASTCAAGQHFVVKDEGGNGGVSTTKISITCNAADTIDGHGTGAGAPNNPVEFSGGYSALTFYTDGVTGWFIF